MNDIEYRQQILDNISASFCAAKWYNATIWLGSGQTTSCHHPPAHAIDITAIHDNPKALHNTSAKKQDRADMQAGRRPAGCEYCWKIEDMGRDAVSDRVYKSRIYPIQAIYDASEMDPNVDVDLRTLEIAFDRTCQLACSYCNPAFSSTWVKDIRTHGPYLALESDGRNHFTHAHDHAQLYRFGEDNPYISAFFRWWETDLHRTLDELRITGGEPLMSGYTWQLLEWFKANQGRSKTRLAINSNLSITRQRLREFIEATQYIENLDVYTSNESVGGQAEYIRDGLDYDLWMHNVQELLEHQHIRAVHSMCTINALCLDSLPEYLDQLIQLKKHYGRDRVNFTLNILRFPSFQSPLVLPDDLRTCYRDRLVQFMVKHKGCSYLHEHEWRHLQRLVDYLDVVKTPHAGARERSVLQNDFAKFYQQYDQRRGKCFVETFPGMAQWYSQL
jgi:hypothetical protein